MRVMPRSFIGVIFHLASSRALVIADIVTELGGVANGDCVSDAEENLPIIEPMQPRLGKVEALFILLKGRMRSKATQERVEEPPPVCVSEKGGF